MQLQEKNKNSKKSNKNEIGKKRKIYKKTNTRKTVKKEIIIPESKSPLKIIPLGGLDEIGKNCTVYEYEDEMKLLAALEISGKDVVPFEEAKSILTELMSDTRTYSNYAHTVVKTENNGYGYISKNYLCSAKLHKILS